MHLNHNLYTVVSLFTLDIGHQKNITLSMSQYVHDPVFQVVEG